MQLALSISGFAEEICKAVEQSASPEMAVANTNRDLLKNRLIKILSTRSLPVAANATDIEQTFHQLAREWREETAHLSSMTKMVMHPKYQRIIGMGPAALPLLFRELQKVPIIGFGLCTPSPMKIRRGRKILATCRKWQRRG